MKSEKNQNIFKKTEESLTKIKIQIPFFKCSILFLSMYVVPNANQMSHLGPTSYSVLGGSDASKSAKNDLQI